MVWELSLHSSEETMMSVHLHLHWTKHWVTSVANPHFIQAQILRVKLIKNVTALVRKTKTFQGENASFIAFKSPYNEILPQMTCEQPSFKV